jgi:hypothetical protein
MLNRMKIPVHIEVELNPACTSLPEEVSAQVKTALTEQCPVFSNGAISLAQLKDKVNSIVACDLLIGQKISFWQADLFIHPYKLVEQAPENDYLEGEEELPVAEQIELPNIFLRGLWESIIVEESIKMQLLSYSCTSILFAESEIDPNIISWNKMLLLYGPPGSLTIVIILLTVLLTSTTTFQELVKLLYVKPSPIKYSSAIPTDSPVD